MTYRFDLQGSTRAESVAAISESLGFLARRNLDAMLRQVSDGRLRLDPTDGPPALSGSGRGAGVAVAGGGAGPGGIADVPLSCSRPGPPRHAARSWAGVASASARQSWPRWAWSAYPASAASRPAPRPVRPPEGEEALQPQHPVQRLRPVPERGHAPAVQLPLGQPPAQRRASPRRPDRRHPASGQPAGDGQRDRVGAARRRGAAAPRPPAPRPGRPRRRPGSASAGAAGPQLAQRHPPVAQLRRRQPEHGRCRRRAGTAPPRSPTPPGSSAAGRRVRPGDHQLAADPHQVEAAVRQHRARTPRSPASTCSAGGRRGRRPARVPVRTMPTSCPAPPTESPAGIGSRAVTELQWWAGAATGVGSMPGTDPAEAIRIVLGELPDLPHLPELPGPRARRGHDRPGRRASWSTCRSTCSRPAGGWSTDPGRDLRPRARTCSPATSTPSRTSPRTTPGPLKLQVAGPWTLAATVELHYGDKAVSDPGAVRDLIQSLAEGVRRHVADVAGRLPDAQVRAAGRRAVAARGAVRPGADRERLRHAAVGRGAGRPRRASPRCWRRRPARVACDGGALLRAASAGDAVPRRRRRRGVVRRRRCWPADEERSAPRSRPASGSGSAWCPPGPRTTGHLGDLGDTVRAVRGSGAGSASRPSSCRPPVVLTPTCGLAGASPAYARAALRRVRREAGPRGRADGDPEG